MNFNENIKLSFDNSLLIVNGCEFACIHIARNTILDSINTHIPMIKTISQNDGLYFFFI
jgi:hypothetical protein